MTKLSQKLIKPKNGSIALRRALMGGSAAVAMGVAFAPTSASAVDLRALNPAADGEDDGGVPTKHRLRRQREW